jgi:hypothetical protein
MNQGWCGLRPDFDETGHFPLSDCSVGVLDLPIAPIRFIYFQN